MPKNTGSYYTEEFKAGAVRLGRSSPEKPIRQLAYELGIATRGLYVTGSGKQRLTVASERGSPSKSVKRLGDSGGKTGPSVRRGNP
jgi:hypothetical protein